MAKKEVPVCPFCGEEFTIIRTGEMYQLACTNGDCNVDCLEFKYCHSEEEAIEIAQWEVYKISL